jgi:hypothetical protein
MEITTPDGTHLNTALATEVAHFSDGRERSDPLHVFEVLYRQRQTWFLRRRRDGKEELIPIMPDQACTWLRQKHFIGALARHFGERVKRTPASAL